MNSTYTTTSQKSTFNTIFNNLYLPYRYCLSNVNGNTSSTFYNSSTTLGGYVNASNTTWVNGYTCGSLINMGGSMSASILETMQALLLAALSLAYLNLV